MHQSVAVNTTRRLCQSAVYSLTILLCIGCANPLGALKRDAAGCRQCSCGDACEDEACCDESGVKAHCGGMPAAFHVPCESCGKLPSFCLCHHAPETGPVEYPPRVRFHPVPTRPVFGGNVEGVY